MSSNRCLEAHDDSDHDQKISNVSIVKLLLQSPKTTTEMVTSAAVDDQFPDSKPVTPFLRASMHERLDILKEIANSKIYEEAELVVNERGQRASFTNIGGEALTFPDVWVEQKKMTEEEGANTIWDRTLRDWQKHIGEALRIRENLVGVVRLKEDNDSHGGSDSDNEGCGVEGPQDQDAPLDVARDDGPTTNEVLEDANEVLDFSYSYSYFIRPEARSEDE